MSMVRALARETGLSLKDIRRLVATAPRRYKVYPIPKRNGEQRIIAQPAFEIKTLQRILVTNFLSKLPVHQSAFAYVRGRNIRANALMHANSDYILKLDFENFFNSIRPMDLERVLRRCAVDGLVATDFEDIYYLTFWGEGAFYPRCLSVGAPSSPIISNIVMFEIDSAAAEAAARHRVIYTRYADDITVSSADGRRGLIAFERELRAIVAASPAHLMFNDAKTGLYGRGDRKMVTGLIITPSGSISIGRERKRIIRATLHRLYSGESSDELLMHCKGMLAFVVSAEPSFLRTLSETYGRDFIRQVLRAPQVSLYKPEDE